MEITDHQLTDAVGNPATVETVDGESVPLTAFGAAFLVLWHMPAREMTLGDSEQARSAIRAMRDAESNGGKWTPDHALHRWTLEQLRAHAPRIFGANGICVVEAFDL